MRILVISQNFYPDEVAVSQYLTDLVEDMRGNGHSVTVLTGIRDYENPSKRYPCIDNFKGALIFRVGSTGFPKSNKFGRLVNFFSFNLALFFRLLFISPRFDAVLCTTAPPMVPVFVSLWAWMRGMPFFYWVMDLQPDESVAAGYIKQESIAACLLLLVSAVSFRLARMVLVLDRFMKQRLETKKIPSSKIVITALWPACVMDEPPYEKVHFFRKNNGWEEKFVVMYSGNHCVCHPLDTILGCSRMLANDPLVVFAFVGGGVRKQEVADFKKKHSLANISLLPYQPRDILPVSLAAADVHLVVMGEGFAGIVHPSKIYGILASARPFIFIGPEYCHVSDMIRDGAGGFHVKHGDAEGLARVINNLQALSRNERRAIGEKGRQFVQSHFNRSQGIKIILTALSDPTQRSI